MVALGGNALLRRGQAADAAVQKRNVATAVRAVAEIARGADVVVTHGNGPQIGLLALQGEAYRDVPGYPLDILGAETEGMVGYLLEQGFENELPGQPVATLLTQVLVEGDDPAFSRPTKPIGPVYEREAAERLQAERGWAIAPDGNGFRRVVPSPEPQAIVELATIRLLLAAGVLVVCVGGGGIPVLAGEDGRLQGVEAVIDKDLAASLLACQIDAEALLLLTDVAAVEAGWGTDRARPIAEASVAELRALDWDPGSMGPKIEAACRFVELRGGTAGIGAIEDAAAILRGERGSRVV